MYYEGDTVENDEWVEQSRLRPIQPSQTGKEWTWTDGLGQTRTIADLQEILNQHKQWLESGGKEGRQADLSKAHLTGANLVGANLIRANLQGAILIGAKLKGAHLSSANLRQTSLSEADMAPAFLDSTDLTSSQLNGADLSTSYMPSANLSKAGLSGTKLHDAFLIYADLSEAFLSDADLTGTSLDGADLKGAFYEPKKNPEARYIANAVNLETISYSKRPDALVTLRKDFKDKGFHDQENKITYAIKRTENELLRTDAYSEKCEDPSQGEPLCGLERRRGQECQNGICEAEPVKLFYYYLDLPRFEYHQIG